MKIIKPVFIEENQNLDEFVKPKIDSHTMHKLWLHVIPELCQNPLEP